MTLSSLVLSLPLDASSLTHSLCFRLAVLTDEANLDRIKARYRVELAKKLNLPRLKREAMQKTVADFMAEQAKQQKDAAVRESVRPRGRLQAVAKSIGFLGRLGRMGEATRVTHTKGVGTAALPDLRTAQGPTRLKTMLQLVESGDVVPTAPAKSTAAERVAAEAAAMRRQQQSDVLAVDRQIKVGLCVCVLTAGSLC